MSNQALLKSGGEESPPRNVWCIALGAVPPWHFAAQRLACGIPHSSAYRAVAVRYPMKECVKVKDFRDTIIGGTVPSPFFSLGVSV